MTADDGWDLINLLERFDEDEETTGRSAPATRMVLQRRVRSFARWMAPRHVLDAVPGDVQRWVDDAGVTASTGSNYIGNLHVFFTWARNDGLIDRDPTAPLRTGHLSRPLYSGDFLELMRGFTVAQQRRGLAKSTMHTRRLEYRLFVDYLAPKSILDATTAEIEAWIDSRPAAARANYRRISDLHMFYRWAKREGMIEEDPTDRIDRPRLPRLMPRPIADDDLNNALNQATPMMRAILSLAAYQGLRGKEVAGVNREDVLEHRDPPVLIVSSPKGNRERIVPLHPETLRALREYGLPRAGPIFAELSKDRSRQIPAWKVQNAANTFLHDVGSTGTLHSLRHWFGTRIYGNTLDLRLTQELLGHQSPNTTAVYAAYNHAGAAPAVLSLTL